MHGTHFYRLLTKSIGAKVIALYNYALSRGADYIFQTDSDGQTNEDEFEAFWDMRDEFDVILGYRYIRGDGKSRAFMNVLSVF